MEIVEATCAGRECEGVMCELSETWEDGVDGLGLGVARQE